MNPSGDSGGQYSAVRPFRILDHYFARMTRAQIVLVSLVIILAFALVDFFTGTEIAFSFFYLIPILMVTWYYNLTAGLLTAVVSIFVWVIVNELAGEEFSSEAIRYWNAGVRMVFFALVCGLLNDLKTTLDMVRRLSSIDPLTSVYNSREFHRLAELEIARARRYSRPLAVAFIDIDNFKTINDRFGHAVGDRLLQAISEILTLSLRANDILGRIGGDEFALLLPEANPSAVEVVLHKIRRMIRDDFYDKEWKTTLSIGAIIYPFPPDNLDEILRKADDLMYQVKASGKNDTLIVSGDDPRVR